MRKGILLLMVIVASVLGMNGQGLTWSVDFNTIFDNREGDCYYSQDGTIFVTRLAPEIGLSMENGKHNISGGVSWIQPIGNGWDDNKICPTLYYRYDTQKWKMAVGMFPQSQLIEPLPSYLQSDSLKYYEPNIRGFLVQYMHSRGYAELSLDWRSLQTDKQREAFNININGRWKAVGAVIAGGRAQVNHLAKQKAAPPGQGVNDDIMLHPYVGLDFSGRTALDSLEIRCGALVAMERARIDDEWINRAGSLVELVARWKWLGLNETFYAGKNLYPLYPRFGTLLNMGDPYYQAGVYSRTDLKAYIIRSRYVNLEATITCQLTKEALGFWQQLKLRVYMDNKLWGTRNEKAQAGERLRNIY